MRNVLSYECTPGSYLLYFGRSSPREGLDQIVLSAVRIRITYDTDIVICSCNFIIVYNETFSLTLKEEHRLRVYENRVLSKVLAPWRNEVTGN